MTVRTTMAAADGPALLYDAPSLCPPESEFAAQLAARLETAPPRPSRDALRVTIEHAGAQFHGRLVARDPDGTESLRELDGDSCLDVVNALALLAAIRLGLPAPGLAAAANDPPSNPPPVHDAADRARASRPSPWRVTLGGAALATSFGGPGVQFGPEAFVDIARDVSRSGLAPALRITALRVQSESVSAEAGGTARFTLQAVGLDACPFRWQVATGAALMLCAQLQAGSLQGSGQSVAEAQTASRFWASAGASAHADVELTRWLVADLHAGAAAPLERHDFFVAPNDSLYSVPTVGGSGGVGLGVRFP